MRRMLSMVGTRGFSLRPSGPLPVTRRSGATGGLTSEPGLRARPRSERQYGGPDTHLPDVVAPDAAGYVGTMDGSEDWSSRAPCGSRGVSAGAVVVH